MVCRNGTGRLSLLLVPEAKQSQRLQQSTKATSVVHKGYFEEHQEGLLGLLKGSSLLCGSLQGLNKRMGVWAEENLQSMPCLPAPQLPDLPRPGLPLQAHQAHKSRVPDHGEVAIIELGEGPAK